MSERWATVPPVPRAPGAEAPGAPAADAPARHGPPPPRRRRWPIVLALLVLLLVGAAWWLLTEDVLLQADWREVNAEALLTLDGRAGYAEHPCPSMLPETVRCGTLAAPLHHDDPSSPLIELAVARLPATGPDPAPDPVIYLEGGPGGFAVADAAWWYDEMGDLLERREVVLLDQRGVGYSDPTLVCTELHDEIDPDADEVEVEVEVEALAACHDRLVADGVDLTAFSTPAIAADVAALRVALEVEEANLLGVSYGTRVALAVLRDHPTGIRSVVLDSVFPLEVRALEEQAVHAAAAIELVLDRCAAAATCAADQDDLDAVIDELNAAPLPLDDGELTGDGLVDAIFGALYAPEALERVPAAIAAAAAGDAEAALDLLDGAVAVGGRIWADEDADGLFYSVTCREDVPVSDLEAALALADALRPTLAEALLLDVERTFAICETWDSGQADPSEAEPVRSEVPALVLAGAYDPITPAAWGRTVANSLSRATYVEDPDLGHALLAGGDCPVGIIAAFLDDPTGPVDTACVVPLP
jgi:pimeloyl-ACP methyl ester carboxylesterase